ncbi:hypothetical protein LTR04_002163, partial [Oleoguttula sp. CCFEE 6159]
HKDVPGWGWRLSSTWGKPGCRLVNLNDSSEPTSNVAPEASGVEKPHELSSREVRWKRMEEEMRKRIEENPYEAIFGKRFEQFWEPLMPAWAKEKMGLDFGGKPVPVQKPAKEARDQTIVNTNAGRTQPRRDVDAPSESAQVASGDSRVYDPISNRMMNVASLDQGKVTRNQAVDIPVKMYKDPAIRETLPTQKSLPPRPYVRQDVQELNERPKIRKPDLPKDDIDLLTASDVRAGMGIIKKPRAAGAEEREQRLARLEKEYARVERENERALRVTREPIETALQRTSRKPVKIGDKKPQQPVQSTTEKKVPANTVDDWGYSLEPQGLETSYAKERSSSVPRDVAEAHRLAASATLPEAEADPYDKTPQGLETSYMRECADQRLNSEFADFQRTRDAAQLAAEMDGYDKTPQGLETSYAREVEREKMDGASKEETNAARLALEVDGYDKTPQGLETSYRRECEQQKESKTSAAERQAEQAAAQLAAEVDGYDKTPQGLETSYARDVARQRSGVKSVEERETDRNAARLAAEVDGYSKAPQGLETAFAREIAAGRKLEDEIKAQKHAMQAHEEDGYSRIPMGLQTAYAEELDACRRGQKKTLEQELKEQRGEGDMCASVVEYSASEKWYKKKAPHATTKEDLKLEQKAKDRALVSEVRTIYENHYGTIDTAHRQNTPTNEFEGRIDEQVHQCLKDHDRKIRADAYRFTASQDDLEAELKAQSQVVMQNQTTPVKPVLSSAATPNSAEATVTESAVSQNAAESSTTPEPAQYKILAYDSGNDIITTATTTTNFPDTSENPISISDALSQLYQPARFIPHFATLQSEGYQVIYSARDLLIFKKKGEAAAATTSEASLETKPAPAVEPIKTIVAEEKADSPSRSVNPIDGTAYPPPQPQTGNYASPTGFVNHDSFAVPAATSEQPMPYQYPSASVPNPRVRREERVFSGSRRRWHDRGSSSRRHERQQRRRFRDRLLWTLSVGTATAVCMYVFGVAAELVRGSAAADREWRSRAQIEEDVALSARRGNGGGQ